MPNAPAPTPAASPQAPAPAAPNPGAAAQKAKSQPVRLPPAMRYEHPDGFGLAERGYLREYDDNLQNARIESPWDALVVGVPGLIEWKFSDVPVTVSAELAINWDVQTGPWMDGAWELYKGYQPAKPKVSWTLWNEEHFQLYQDLLSVLRPKPGRTRPPIIKVEHPLLAMHQLVTFNLAGVSVPQAKGKGMFEASLSLIEWFQSPKLRAGTTDEQMNASLQKQLGSPPGPIPPPRLVNPP